ncbi:hypothetical protein AURDEDRAFT_164012 [Auricularia subglabra TFB-10046 SS5]|nr:hypothetical protein AURDEDRAFT_164012 [Auricularia subglabra TFB-10046 SS5]
MSSAEDLPVELVLHILELAVRDSIVDALHWALSLLRLSHFVHVSLMPHVYYNLRITPGNSDAFLNNTALLPYLRHVHTLQFIHLASPSQQRAWADSCEHMKGLSHVKHFRGPRKICKALAGYDGFTPVRWRSDPPVVAESILVGPVKAVTRTTVQDLTHCYMAYLSPIRVVASRMPLPPGLTHVCLVPHAVANAALFLNEIARFRGVPSMKRLVVRLGFLTTWTSDGQAARPACARLIRSAGAQWKDPNVFLDESNADYDLDDDEQWFIGEPIWRAEPE